MKKTVPDAPDSNTVAKTYTWGLDLSESLQGAGGVGGLLAVTEYNATGNETYYPSYDANGNISEYVDASDSVVAHYEYSPFGKITSSSGTKAGDFRHCFSSKYLDSETNLYYYGYRYYSSELGRWISRDPIQEEGGVNLYVFARNNCIDKADGTGLFPIQFIGNKLIDIVFKQLINAMGLSANDPLATLTINPDRECREKESKEIVY